MLRPTEQYPVLRAGLGTTQIIVVGLVVGLLVFSGIVLFMIASPEVAGEAASQEEPEGAFLTPILVGLSVVVGSTILLVASSMLGKATRGIAEGTWKSPVRRKTDAHGAVGVLSPSAFEEAGDAGRLFQAWMSATLVRAAGLEGAAFLCLVAALIEHSPLALAVGGFWALLLAFQIPTASRLDHWLEGALMKLPRDRKS